MLDLLLQDGLRPFLAAGGLVICLLALEVLLLTAGISTEIGGDHDGGLGLDVTPDVGDHVAPPASQEVGTYSGATSGSLLDLLGLRGVPLTVWLAFLAASFAALGFVGQSALSAALGWMLPAWPAGLAAAVPALLVTARAARVFAGMLPRETTAAVSEKAFGRRFGDVTVGVARAGSPAQVRVTDQHGNLQYLMAEPLDAKDEFREGTRVLVLRAHDGRYRLLGAE